MKKIISLVSILFICLSVLIPCNLYADEPSVGLYYWIERGVFVNRYTSGSVASRFISRSNQYKLYVLTENRNSKLYVIVYANFENQADRTSFKTANPIFRNYITNGQLASQSTSLTLTDGSYSYNTVSGTQKTEYFTFYSFEVNSYFYNSNLIDTYSHFETVGTTSVNLNATGYVASTVCYLEHGVNDTIHNVNDMFNVIEIRRSYPFVFAPSNSGGDQRTHDPETEPNNTINIHPQDVFNTYEINRETNNTTIDFDTYIIPNAVNNNGTVIQDSDLRYQDFTYNTEFNISNVENYYSDDGNDSGDNGGNGSINNSGVTITVSEGALQQQQQQYQTIEENAVNVTVNNNNNVDQNLVNDISQIIQNTPEATQNTFQTTIQNISAFTAIGSTFAQLASAFLSFLPSWVVSLLGITFAIVFFLIVIRLIHLFI